MRSEFVGSIMAVRAAEDCIRATKKYTKGAFYKGAQHPIQGEGFPSKVITEYYEVYPDLDIDQQRPFWDAVMAASDWLWGDTPHIDIRFNYNYTRNRAMMVIFGNNGVIDLLRNGVPGLGEAMDGIKGGSDSIPAE